MPVPDRTHVLRVANTGRQITIAVSAHALQRYLQRCGPGPAADRTIRLEVAAALEEGRVACRQPRWATPPGRQRPRGSRALGFARFVWPDTLDRCYLVRRHRWNGAPTWVVVTTIVPPARRAAA